MMLCEIMVISMKKHSIHLLETVLILLIDGSANNNLSF
jgi:hypothetical protein